MAPRLTTKEKEELAQERRDQIVQAAMRLWAAEGFDTTTVDAIAREAGLAKGTVYLYFNTKDDILDAAIRRHSLLPDVQKQFAILQKLDVSPEAVLPLMLKALWAAAKERAGVLRILLREIIVRPEYARQLVETVIVPTNKLVAEFLRPHVESGKLRELDMFIAARALAGMVMVFVLTQEIFEGKAIHPLSDDDITDTIAEVFLRGVLVRPDGS